MFAAGFENMVSDQLRNPSKYDGQELEAIERKAHKQDDRGNLFSILCRQLFWGRVA